MSLSDKIAAEVVAELRLKLLVADLGQGIGPIADADAEASVVSAVLCGEVEPSELPIGARHFFVDVHRALWQARLKLGPFRNEYTLVPDIEALIEWLRRNGWRGIAYEDIEHIVIRPVVLLPRLVQVCKSLIELYERRNLVMALEDTVRGLRTGNLRAAEAIERVKAIAASAHPNVTALPPAKLAPRLASTNGAPLPARPSRASAASAQPKAAPGPPSGTLQQRRAR